MGVHFVIIGTVFFAFGTLIAGIGVWALRSGFSISESEPTAISEAATSTEPVEFEGVASDEYTFDAPFSGREAVACTYRVRERKRRGTDRDKEWRTVESGRITHPFVVEDESGRVVVDPTEATAVDTGGRRRNVESVSGGGSLSDATRLRLSALTDTLDDLESIFPTSNRRRYDEGVIEPGEDIHVYGGKTEPTPNQGDIDATVSNAANSQYRITAGGESDAVGRAYQLAVYTLLTGGLFGVFGVGILLIGIGII